MDFSSGDEKGAIKPHLGSNFLPQSKTIFPSTRFVNLRIDDFESSLQEFNDECEFIENHDEKYG